MRPGKRPERHLALLVAILPWYLLLRVETSLADEFDSAEGIVCLYRGCSTSEGFYSIFDIPGGGRVPGSYSSVQSGRPSFTDAEIRHFIWAAGYANTGEAHCVRKLRGELNTGERGVIQYFYPDAIEPGTRYCGHLDPETIRILQPGAQPFAVSTAPLPDVWPSDGIDMYPEGSVTILRPGHPAYSPPRPFRPNGPVVRPPNNPLAGPHIRPIRPGLPPIRPGVPSAITGVGGALTPFGTMGGHLIELGEAQHELNQQYYQKLIDAARQGDRGAQAELITLGIDWEKERIKKPTLVTQVFTTIICALREPFYGDSGELTLSNPPQYEAY